MPKLKKEEKFIADMLGIKLRNYNIKYKQKIPGPRKDCTTRALSRLLNIEYYDVLKMQLSEAYNIGTVHANYEKVTENILSNAGYITIKVNRRQSVAQFMYEHKTGRYAIVAGGHIVAYINGTWYDDELNFNNVNAFLGCNIYKVYYKK